MTNRVRVNSYYHYIPTQMAALVEGEHNFKTGDLLQVRNIRNCPPANTMGFCYAFNEAGEFGLVLTSSLDKAAAGNKFGN